MKILITDANVFFDIIEMGLLPEFFALDFEICTTDLVVEEIRKSDQRSQIDAFIRAHNLKVFELSEIEIEEIGAFQTKRKFKGITDKSVLWKSHKLKCTLLTGDKKLQTEAKELGITVHGSIWVFDMIISNELVTKRKGIELLEKLLLNPFLPEDEIDKLIKKFR